MKTLSDLYVITSEYCAHINRVVGVLVEEADIKPFVNQYIRDHHSRLAKVTKLGMGEWKIDDPSLDYMHYLRVFRPDYT